jgi:choline monooxygenase
MSSWVTVRARYSILETISKGFEYFEMDPPRRCAYRRWMSALDEIYGPTLARGAGLPGEAFTSEALFQPEMRRVFHRSWCCIGLAADVSQPNHLRPITLLGQPLLVVHNCSGIEVFHNVCSHRGAVLVSEPRLSSRNLPIVCPYHSWTYALDGALLRTPHAGGAGVHEDPVIDHRACGLKRMRSAIWHGLIFVNLSNDAPPFEAFIAPLAQRTVFLKAGSLHHDATQSRAAAIGANWKIVVENFVESYHLPPVHRDLQSVNPMALHYQILGGASYVGQGGDGRDWQKAGEHDLPPRPAGGFKSISEYEVFWLCPNLIFQPIGHFLAVLILLPQSATVTHERLEFFFYGPDALQDTHADERARQVEFLTQVNNEDIRICERTQAGRGSLAFTGGVFCPRQETSSLRVQQIIAAHMLHDAPQAAESAIPFSFEDIRHSDRAGAA